MYWQVVLWVVRVAVAVLEAKIMVGENKYVIFQ